MFDKQIYLDVIKLQHMLGGEKSTMLTNCGAGTVCCSQPITVFCRSFC